MLTSVVPDKLMIHLGRILAGFGDIEYTIVQAVGVAIEDDGAACRALYRMMGSDVRLQVADALMRPTFMRIGLSDEYNEGLGAFRFSKKIRNQYAHAHWYPSPTHGLFFVDFEKPAKTTLGTVMLSPRPVDAELLVEQWTYLNYAWKQWQYLRYELQKRMGGLSSHTWIVQKIIPKPPLHSPLEKYPLPPELIDDESPPIAPPPGSSPEKS
jgi:hypothetical protein